MVSNIYLLAGELKDLLDNDERIIRLNKLENELNNNEEVMALSYQKDLAVSAYSDALNHFANNSEEIKKYQHELFLKKEALDNHPLVKEYLKAYSEVRNLYFQINEILFNDVSLHIKEKRILK
ncbi:MAG: YlbF family regulator [Bacilli bacterium]|nr:YlbF family regulator [Bacilli bacterium]